MDATGETFEEGALSVDELREKENVLDEIAGKFRSDFYFYSISTAASGVLLLYGVFGNWPVSLVVVAGVAVGFGWAFRCYRRWQETIEQLEEVKSLIALRRTR